MKKTIMHPVDNSFETVIYKCTGKRIGNSFEYQSITKTNAPHTLFFSQRKLKEIMLPNCPILIFMDTTVPEYVATVMYSTTA